MNVRFCIYSLLLIIGTTTAVAADQAPNLDLSVPEEALQYKPADGTNASASGIDEGEQGSSCTALARQIDALRGQLKPAKRSALVNRYRAECQGKGPWEADR